MFGLDSFCTGKKKGRNLKQSLLQIFQSVSKNKRECSNSQSKKLHFFVPKIASLTCGLLKAVILVTHYGYYLTKFVPRLIWTCYFNTRVGQVVPSSYYTKLLLKLYNLQMLFCYADLLRNVLFVRNMVTQEIVFTYYLIAVTKHFVLNLLK